MFSIRTWLPGRFRASRFKAPVHVHRHKRLSSHCTAHEFAHVELEPCSSDLELRDGLCSRGLCEVDRYVGGLLYPKSIVPVQLRTDSCLGSILSQPSVSSSLKVNNQESCGRYGQKSCYSQML